MNTYIEQAEQFLRDTKTKLTIKENGTKEVWGNERYAYKITLKNPKGRYTFDFYGSITGFKSGKELENLSSYDVLACLYSDYNDMTLEEFCNEFCYNTDSIEHNKIYKNCVKQAKGLKRIFTIDQLDLLAEIN